MGSDPKASGTGVATGPWEELRSSSNFQRASAGIRSSTLSRRSPTRAHPNGYRRLLVVKPCTSFENADDGFSRRHHHVGCISAEPLVVPIRVAIYIEGRIAPPTKADFLGPDTLAGLVLRNQYPDPLSLFGWAPATAQQCLHRVPTPIV